MHGTRGTANQMEPRGGLVTPRRNRFFHGKMMDVHHFEMETAYGIAMRRLLNRLVTGEGVVCGLDVVRSDEPCSIAVSPGLAVDGWGREIVVPKESAPVVIPRALVDRVCGRPKPRPYGDEEQSGTSTDAGAARGDAGDEDPRREEPGRGDQGHGGHGHDHHDRHRDEACVTALLCYQECESDPVAVLAGDCSTSTSCAPGAIREQYRIEFAPGCVDPVEINCRFPDILSDGELDYGVLARWVTRECADPPRNPCIPLANVYLDCRDDGCDIDKIDIEIRPIVIGNTILFEILSRIVEEERAQQEYRR